MYNKIKQYFTNKEHYENQISILKDMIKEKEAIVYGNNYQLRKTRETNQKLKEQIDKLEKEKENLIKTVLIYEKKQRQQA